MVFGSADVMIVPVLHPSLLVCLKLCRWKHIAELTQPQFKAKASNDALDINFLLSWLSDFKQHISFQGMDEQRKAALLQGFKLFLEKNPEARKYLITVLEPADLKIVGL